MAPLYSGVVLEKEKMLCSVQLTALPAAGITFLNFVLENFTCLMVVRYKFRVQLQMVITEPEDLGTLPSTVSQLVPSLDSSDVRSQMLMVYQLTCT